MYNLNTFENPAPYLKFRKEFLIIFYSKISYLTQSFTHRHFTEFVVKTTLTTVGFVVVPPRRRRAAV